MWFSTKCFTKSKKNLIRRIRIYSDEAHHGTANTYKDIISFKPRFTLGLTATPDRTDGEDLLEIFQNIAHKLDLETAVEIGELVLFVVLELKPM